MSKQTPNQKPKTAPASSKAAAAKNAQHAQKKRQTLIILAVALGMVVLALALALLLLKKPTEEELQIMPTPTPAATPAASSSESFDPAKQYVATIKTDKGDIVIELNAKVAPKTVENFVKLSRQGFYDGLTFHRVVANFVVQGGDPKGDGTGGPGYDLDAEISNLKHLKGTVATARKGDQVNPQRRSSGSQFYICLEATPHLDGQYTIFGQVTKGMDVVEKTVVGDVMREVTITEKP